MLIPTIIMGILAGILLIIGYRQGQGQHIEGLRAAYHMTIQIIPLLNIRVYRRWISTNASAQRATVEMAWCRIRISGNRNRNDRWWTESGRTLCQFAHRCRAVEIRCKRGHDGKLSDRLVIVGGCPFTYGSRNFRLEFKAIRLVSTFIFLP